jgi:hypothetical protein
MTATSGTPHDGFGPKALDLDAIEARANAASPEPWEPGSAEPGHISERQRLVWPRYGTGAPLCRLERPGRREQDDADAEFIAHARTDVPALVERVRELEARMQRAAAHLHVGAIGAALRELEGAP